FFRAVRRCARKRCSDPSCFLIKRLTDRTRPRFDTSYNPSHLTTGFQNSTILASFDGRERQRTPVGGFPCTSDILVFIPIYTAPFTVIKPCLCRASYLVPAPNFGSILRRAFNRQPPIPLDR